MKTKSVSTPLRIVFVMILIIITLILTSCGETELTMKISLSSGPYIPGPITVTVSFSGVDASNPPTGLIMITGADENCTVTLESGDLKGNCYVIFNSTGEKTITATYLGDKVYAGQTATQDLTIIPRPTPTGQLFPLTSPTIDFIPPTPNSALLDEEITAAIKVSGSSSAPTGKVDILNGDGYGCEGLTLDSAGSASCQVSVTHTGSEQVNAKYYGDEHYTEASETFTMQVDKFTSVVTITSCDYCDPPIFEDTTSFTIQVTSGAPNPLQYPLTGTVTITGDRIRVYNQPTPSADGTAEVQVWITSVGPFSVVAEYSGDEYNSSAVSDPMSFTSGYWQALDFRFPNPNYAGSPLLPNEPIEVVAYMIGGNAPAAPTGSITFTADTSCTAPLTPANPADDPEIYDALGGTDWPGFVTKATCQVSFTSARDGAVITAHYPGDSIYHSETETRTYDMTDWIDSTTTITGVLPETPLVGDWVTVIVEVEAGGNNPPEGYGYVNITGADTTCTIYLYSDTNPDRCSVKFNSKGTKTLIATYTGFGGIYPSQDTWVIEITKPEPTPTPID